MKKIITHKIEIKLPVHYCDGCKKQISVITNTNSYFRKGAFQTGQVRGKIGDWCSEKCLTQYENLTSK